MRFRSTRKEAPETDLRGAVLEGLAPDGGLYLPEELPSFSPSEVESLRGRAFREIVDAVTLRLFGQEVGVDAIRRVAREALDFEVPVADVGKDRTVVELFHGPTGSFKDTGARFLSRLLPVLQPDPDRPVLVVVATSGDTGGAVIDAFRDVAGSRAVVLYPKGRVSPVQLHQMVVAGEGARRVRALPVRGSFDDCQRMVKAALRDGELNERAALTSANSINVGRLLPQVFHYFHAWAHLPGPGNRDPVISVPTGNVGHLVSGVLAWRMGLPVSRFVAATNENDALVQFLETGSPPEGTSRSTLSSAMDVARPSNLERLTALFDEDLHSLRQVVGARSYTDPETLEAIGAVHERWGYLMDPHTAVGWLAMEAELKSRTDAPGALLATADPAKFPDVVERASGVRPTAPPAWGLDAPREDTGPAIGPELEELRPVLTGLLET